MDAFAELADYELDPEAIRRLARDFCVHHQVVVLGSIPEDAREVVHVGMLHPENGPVRTMVGRRLLRPVKAVRLNAFEIARAISLGHDGPRARGGNGGLLLPVDAPPARPDAGVSRIKVLCGLDITERRAPQDGRFRVRLEERPGETPVPIDLRVSPAPGLCGEDVAMRVLRTAGGALSLEALGFDPERRQTVESLLANPEGLILVTGPTGSGKTTTLYSMLDTVRDGTKKVLTAEDPNEVVLEKVSQKQVTPLAGMAELARAFLRQDPDIMMIGEICDADTATTAMRGAGTGHLVLSTLHTPDAWSCVQRLEGLGIDPDVVAEVALGVVAQRLARRLCPACSGPARAPPRQARLFGGLLEGVPLRGAAGCEACKDTGYRGRLGLFEVLVFDERLLDDIMSDRPGHEVRDELRRRGHINLVQDGLRRLRAGDTSLDELTRVLPFRAIEAERTFAEQNGGRVG